MQDVKAATSTSLTGWGQHVGMEGQLHRQQVASQLCHVPGMVPVHNPAAGSAASTLYTIAEDMSAVFSCAAAT